MITEASTGEGPVPRIVRIGTAAGPFLALVTVLAVTWIGGAERAWIPLERTAGADAWQQPLPPVQHAVVTLQTALGRRLWPADPVGGALGVAAGLGALVTAGLVVALRRAGLTTTHAVMLALVAAAAPLAAWQASSPLGFLPLTLASLAVLLWTTAGPRATWLATRWRGALLVVGAVAATLADAGAGASLIRGELGLAGLVLGLGNLLAIRSRARRPHLHGVLTTTLLLLVLTTPLPAAPQVAILTPWLWWLVGAGLTVLLLERGPRAQRWATVGLAGWVALHAAQVPWHERRQEAAAARTWADGVVAAVAPSRPLVAKDSPRGHLAATLAIARHGPAAIIDDDAVRLAVEAGRTPIVVDGGTRARWRWAGVGFATPSPAPGVPLHVVLDAFPPGTVVLAAIAGDAATHLTPADWRALSRIGLRSADAGQPRAHVVAGQTHVRVAGLHRAGPGHVRLDIQPGDPLGHIDGRSPLDARLEATATDVALTVRGRRLHAGRGVLVTLWTARGDLLAWRSGPDPSRLHGAVSGRGDATVSEALLTLPCVDVAPGDTADISAPALAGSLVLTGEDAARVEVRTVVPEGVTIGPVAWLETPPAGATLRTVDAATFVIERPGRTPPVAVALRRRVTRATASATAPVTVCGTWPMTAAEEPQSHPIVVDMGPGDEVYVSDGWHDREGTDGQWFRWTAGPRATIVVALRDPAPLQFVLHAQTADGPVPGDRVRITVNETVLTALPLVERRARHGWSVPASAWRRGLNTIVIESPRTVRPADRTPGADGRTLGLAIHGWSLRPGGDGGPRTE